MINKLLYQVLASTMHEKNKKVNNNFKISGQSRYNKFELPDESYSVSDIQDYFEYIIIYNETVINNPPIRFL